MRLMRETPQAPSCGSGSQNLCNNVPATTDDYANLQEKYGFNMGEYFQSALDCARDGPEDSVPDVWDLPADGAAPLCWFGKFIDVSNREWYFCERANACDSRIGIRAKKGVEDCGIYTDGPQTCNINFSDF